MSSPIILTAEERNALKKVVQTISKKNGYDCFDIYALPEPVKMDYYVYQDDPVAWMDLHEGKYFFDYWKQQMEI